MEETTVMEFNDSINLQGAPHTVCEISRESLSTIPEKSDEEIYAQEDDSTPEEGTPEEGGDDPGEEPEVDPKPETGEGSTEQKGN